MVQNKGSVGYLWLILIGLVILAISPLLTLGGHQADAQAAGCWKAEITRQWNDLDLAGSVLRVSVEGKVGLPVVVRSRGDFEAVGFTGTKPEYGPYVAEFAPLSQGTYFIERQDNVADVVVDVGAVIEKKIAALAEMDSQMFEWLPWIGGRLSEVPEGKKERFEWYRQRRLRSRKGRENRYYQQVAERYGKAHAENVQFVEAFELCEYGRQPSRQELWELFPK